MGKKLGTIEQKWGALFKSISDCNLNNQEIKDIKRFALYQRYRTHSHNEYVQNMKEELLKATVKFQLDYENYPYNETMLNSAATRSSKTNNNIVRNLEATESYENAIDDLNMLLIKYDTESELIIGDDPIIVINRFVERNVGLGSIGLIIFFRLHRICWWFFTIPNYIQNIKKKR